MKYCLKVWTDLERCNLCRLANRYKISELFPFTVTGPPVIHSSSLPLSLRFKMALRAQGSYRHPARLDTGRVASTYPGGVSTRLSINHFQSARPTFCYGYFPGIEIWTQADRGTAKTLAPIAQTRFREPKTRNMKVFCAVFICTSFSWYETFNSNEPISRQKPMSKRATKPAET
jgi:hypothetical protein